MQIAALAEKQLNLCNYSYQFMAGRQVGPVKKISHKTDEISPDLSLTRGGSLLKLLLNGQTDDLRGASEKKSRTCNQGCFVEETMKRYWQWMISLLAVLMFALSGCGGGGGGGGGGGPIPGVTDTDGDGIPDTEDTFPNDATRFVSLAKVDLPGLQGTTFSSAVAVNDSNLIAGTANDNTNDVHAVVWSLTGTTASQASRLELLAGAPAPVFGAAHGVNNAADAVGESEDSTGDRQAIFWLGSGGSPSAASPTILPELTGAQFSAAYDINSGRRVVGESQSSGVTKAVTWLVTVSGATITPSAATMLGEPAGGTSSSAYFIGEGNQVVGEYTTAGGAVRGLLWNLDAAGAVTSMVELPPLTGDTESVAYGINDDGQIIGESSSATTTRAAVWTVAGTPATATAALLGSPAAGEANALAINDSGRLAGWTAASVGGAATTAVWDLRNLTLFNEVLTTFSQGYGINNGGTIVGMANNAAFVTVAQ